MILNPKKPIPTFISISVVLLLCAIRLLRLDFPERLERMTYDFRVRQAAKSHPIVATNFGFVSLDEDSITFVQTNRSFGYGLYWPRSVYGRLVQELADQGAKLVALDVIFAELRPDHAAVRMADNSYQDADDFFAAELRHAGNVILTTTHQKPTPLLFATNALALSIISSAPDADGVLRRVRVFQDFTNWHRAFRQVEADPAYGVDLSRARIEPRQVVMPRVEGEDIKIPLDENGNFDLTDFWGEKLPSGIPRKARPQVVERYWQMGLVLGAQALGLDLHNAVVDLPHGRIILPGAGGLQRVIPVDADGYFYIDWCIKMNHPQLEKESVRTLLAQSTTRLKGQTNGLNNLWHGRLAVVGSGAVLGNDLMDHGATPLEEDTFLASKHWNVANSIITGRFVRRAPVWVELGLIVLLGGLAAFFTWEIRVLLGSILVGLLVLAYLGAASMVYAQSRYWIPIVFPLAACVSNHIALAIWRVVFEQTQRKRVKTVFSKLVSSKIVDLLLEEAEALALGGARREITVLFADVRGFTAFTEASQERVAEYVQTNKLSGAAAELCYEEQARETLKTVNLYLGLIADVIKKHDGVLDKFMGDCVMAFWGAPSPTPTPMQRHAASGVRAAIEAQRAIYEINKTRATENKQRQLENVARLSAGLPLKPMLAVLLLGTGINTGMATAGLMGSSGEEGQNYTVFGREVNLASRLESTSGRGRIYIGETTYLHLRRDDPELAKTCIELPPKDLKGFRIAVKVYEVPWLPPGAPPFDEEFSFAASTDATMVKGFVQRS
jgi:class 3 adenylate cyclase/CHASE2 domain-containing sensor protein